MQFYVFYNAVPDTPYDQEKFLRRFLPWFPVPRLALLIGASLFVTGVFCLGSLLLERLPAIIVGCSIAVMSVVYDPWFAGPCSVVYQDAALLQLSSSRAAVAGVPRLGSAQDDIKTGRRRGK
jgi:hypothetical protein